MHRVSMFLVVCRDEAVVDTVVNCGLRLSWSDRH